VNETVQISNEKPEQPETKESIKEPVIDILGRRIDTKAMNYAPTNELGVIFLAGHLWDRLGISHIEQMNGNSFPDAIGVTANKTDNKDILLYKRIKIEFEYVSSNFKLHGHPIDQCDIIICWINDWKDCPIRVIDLKNIVKGYYQKKSERMEHADSIDEALNALSHGSSYIDGFKKFEEDWEKLKMRIV